jgi:hypothetical protein
MTNCLNCKFYGMTYPPLQGKPEDLGSGRCHRYPPILVIPEESDNDLGWGWPMVFPGEDGWCGEYMQAADKS